MSWWRVVFGGILLLAFVSVQGTAQEAGVSPAELQRLAGGTEASTQSEIREGPRTKVILASPQVLPGGKAYVTVLLTNSPDVSLTELEHWLEFPQDKLSFVSARLGISADLAKAKLELEQPVAGSAPNQLSLHFAVKAAQPIPDGPVIELTFDVGDDLSPETIVLPHRFQSRGSDGQEIANVDFGNPELVVSQQLPDAPPAIFSCFFYMH